MKQADIQSFIGDASLADIENCRPEQLRLFDIQFLLLKTPFLQFDIGSTSENDRMIDINGTKYFQLLLGLLQDVLLFTTPSIIKMMSFKQNKKCKLLCKINQCRSSQRNRAQN